MKRLTDKRLALPPGVWHKVTREKARELKEIPVPSKQDLYYRLSQIEDILGDKYDLDRLRELVEADREMRFFLLPCTLGDRLLLKATGTYYTVTSISALITQAETIITMDVMDDEGHSDYIHVESLGVTVFPAEEDAAKEKEKVKSKTAQWVHYLPVLGAGDVQSRCSNCGHTADVETPYCAWCGAEMEDDT